MVDSNYIRKPLPPVFESSPVWQGWPLPAQRAFHNRLERYRELFTELSALESRTSRVDDLLNDVSLDIAILLNLQDGEEASSSWWQIHASLTLGMRSGASRGVVSEVCQENWQQPFIANLFASEQECFSWIAQMGRRGEMQVSRLDKEEEFDSAVCRIILMDAMIGSVHSAICGFRLMKLAQRT